MRVPGVGPLVVFAQNLAADVPVAPGDEVRLSWSPRHAFALPDRSAAPAPVEAPRPAAVAR